MCRDEKLLEQKTFNKSSCKSVFVLALMAIIIISLMYINNKSRVKSSTYCNLDNSACLLSTSIGETIVSVSPFPVMAESEVTFSIEFKQLEQPIGKITANIVGRDMYMGRIPLKFVNESAEQYLGKSFIGACTEPEMVWLLELDVTLASGENVKIPFEFNVRN